MIENLQKKSRSHKISNELKIVLIQRVFETAGPATGGNKDRGGLTYFQ